MHATTRPIALLTIMALFAGGCTQFVKPAPPELYAVGGESVFDRVAPELRRSEVDVLYVTDRKPEQDDPGRATYGIGRSKSLAYGSARVSLSAGANTDWEELVAWTESREGYPAGGITGKLVSVEERGRFPATPYLFLTDEHGRRRMDPDFQREVDAAMKAAAGELRRRLALASRRDVLILVHGIQTRFDDFVIDAARHWHIEGRTGVPVAYSWSAGGGGLLSAYAYDRESSEFTIPHLKQFLRLLAGMPEVERVHVVAHSRGTDVATAAIRELFIEARAADLNVRKEFKIENVVLIAPDLDLEVIEQRLGAELFGSEVGRVTIYTSADDTAIAAAKYLFDSRARLGGLRPDQLDERQRELLRRSPNVDIIVYSGNLAGIFGHSYFRNPAMTADSILLIRDGRKPGVEHGRPLEPLGDNFWRLGDDYLR